MGIVIGFGKSETDFEKQEFQALREHLIEFKNSSGISYFDDAFEKSANDFLEKRCANYDAKRDEYNGAKEYPSRYSTYYFDVLRSANNLCVVMRFSHINRRHALSPDGWAMLNNHAVFHIWAQDRAFT